MKIIRVLAVVAIASVALLGAVPAQASHKSKHEIVNVYHQAVSPIATTGSGIGTVRTFFTPIAIDGMAADGQYLTGTLTTLAQGLKDNQELRGSNLTFVMGEEADQLVVGGISLYAPAGATLAPGARTIRPVIGGSGDYKGARGQVVSTNLGANGWTHVFDITLP